MRWVGDRLNLLWICGIVVIRIEWLVVLRKEVI